MHEVSVSRAATLLLLEEFELQHQVVRVLASMIGINGIPRCGAGTVAGYAGGDPLTSWPVSMWFWEASAVRTDQPKNGSRAIGVDQEVADTARHERRKRPG